MYKLYELWSDYDIMKPQTIDLSPLVYIVVMITIFLIAL